MVLSGADLFTLLGTILLSAAFVLHAWHNQKIHDATHRIILMYAQEVLEAVIDLQKREARRLLKENKAGQKRVVALKKKVDDES